MQTLLQTSQSEFPVVDDAGKPVGLLTRADIIRDASKTSGRAPPSANAMTSDLPTLGSPPLSIGGIQPAAGENGAGRGGGRAAMADLPA